MAGPDKKTSFRLSGGVDNRSQSEFVEPVVVQGSEPKLVQSVNTRLSKVRSGVVRSPKVSLIANGIVERYGLIPAAAGKRTAMVSQQTRDASGNFDVWNYVVIGDGTSGSGVPGFGSNAVGGPYALARIVGAGELDGLRTVSPIAQVYDAASGLIYRAQITYEPVNVDGSVGFVNVYASASHPDGRDVSPMMSVVTGMVGRPSHTYWVGLTSHPTAGVFVWSLHNAADTPGGGTGLFCTRIRLNGTVVSASDPPQRVADPVDKSVTPDVIAAGEYAYVIAGSSSSATATTITRVQLAANGSATFTNDVTLPATVNGKTRCALHRVVEGANAAVFSAVSREGGTPKTSVARWSDALASTGSALEVDYAGTVVIMQTVTTAMLLIGVARDFTPYINGGSSDFTILGTRIYLLSTPTGTWATPALFTLLHYLLPYSRGAQWQAPDGMSHPIGFFVPRYGKTTTIPGEVDYADDPAIFAYDLTSGSAPAPIARFACVRGSVSPVMTFDSDDFASRGDIVIGDKIWCGWRKIDNQTTLPHEGIGRFTCLDLRPTHAPIAHDKDGGALVACSAPAFFDGAMVKEMSGPQLSPHIAWWLAPNTASPNAVYRFAVVFEMTDASGNITRSRPSNVLTVTLNTSSTQTIFSSVPPRLMAGSNLRVLFFGSTANGTSLHLFASILPLPYGGFALFNPSLLDESAEQLYSTGTNGEELTPQPPPPLRDVAIVGNRAVGIDAEFPTRIPYTKIRVAGVGYEWFPAGEMHLPSGAGEGMAAREWNGVTTVFAERGVYQIAGDGPNNSGSGGSFATPVKISDIGCTNTASVVEYPGGIMWQSGNRFARLSGAGVAYDMDFACSHDVSVAVCMPRHEEVLFFSAEQAEIRVFNYGVGRWTTWDADTLPVPVTSAVALPWDEDTVLTYSASDRSVRRIAADSMSTAEHMTFETGWVLLDGDFQSHVLLRDVVYTGVLMGLHWLEISVYCDYDDAPSTVRTWSPGEIGALANSHAGFRYTVRLEPQIDRGRAFKIRIRDTLHQSDPNGGTAPVAVTLVWSVDGQLFEEVFNATAHK